MEPDFQSFASAWLQGDPRTQELGQLAPEVQQRIARRIAEALEKRRQQVAARGEDDACLVVNVPEEGFQEGAIEPGVLSQLEAIVQEHIHKLEVPEN